MAAAASVAASAEVVAAAASAEVSAGVDFSADALWAVFIPDRFFTAADA